MTERDAEALAEVIGAAYYDNPDFAVADFADGSHFLNAARAVAGRIAEAKADALRETARDVLAGAPVGNERYTGVQIERYLNARANRIEAAAALAHPSTDPDG